MKCAFQFLVLGKSSSLYAIKFMHFAILSWVTFMLYFIVLQNIKIEIVK